MNTMSYSQIARAIVNLAPDAYDMQRIFDKMVLVNERLTLTDLGQREKQRQVYAQFVHLLESRDDLIKRMEAILKWLKSDEMENINEVLN